MLDVCLGSPMRREERFSAERRFRACCPFPRQGFFGCLEGSLGKHLTLDPKKKR